MKYIYCFLFLLQISFAIGQEPCNFHLNTERVQYIRDVLGQQTNKNYNGQMPMVLTLQKWTKSYSEKWRNSRFTPLNKKN
jgi:hypothetical protein